MKKIRWMDKIRNEEVSAQVNEIRIMLNTKQSWKRRWMGHVLQNDKLLCNLMEGNQ